MKNEKFSAKMNKYAVARMVEQSVWMDAIFQAGRTEPMTDTEVAFSLFFAGTLDLYDVIKEVKHLKIGSNIDITKKLIDNQEFVDTLGKKLNGATDEGWNNLSQEQRNIARADAR